MRLHTDASDTASTLNDSTSITSNHLVDSNTKTIDDEKSISGKGGEVLTEEKSIEEEVWTYPEGGLQAWKSTLACFIFASSSLGYGLAWGSFLQQLRADNYQDVPISKLNLIVGLSNYMMAATSFFGGRLGDTYGYKNLIAIGGFLTFINLIIIAFTYQYLALLFLFQGFFLGITQGISLPIVMSIPSQYFLKKRGLATGMAISGTGFGGAISSLIVRALLPSMGYRKTILIYAGINAIAWTAAWFLLEIRLPPLKAGERKVSRNWLPKGVWSDVAFYSFCGAISISVWGYLSTFYFITDYTLLNVPNIDPNSLLTAFPLIMTNVASGFGRIASGIIADLIGPVNALFLTFFLGGLLQILFWPFATTYSSIIVFGVCYGFLGTGFISLIPVCAAQLFGTKNLATISGFVVLCNSPPQFAGATVMALVLEATGSYASLARTSGGVAALGALLLLPARFSRERRLIAKY